MTVDLEQDPAFFVVGLFRNGTDILHRPKNQYSE
jgi:hypothetical protein